MLGFKMSASLKREVDLLFVTVQRLLEDHKANVAHLFKLSEESTQLNVDTRRFYDQVDPEPEKIKKNSTKE